MCYRELKGISLRVCVRTAAGALNLPSRLEARSWKKRKLRVRKCHAYISKSLPRGFFLPSFSRNRTNRKLPTFEQGFAGFGFRRSTDFLALPKSTTNGNFNANLIKGKYRCKDIVFQRTSTCSFSRFWHF